MKKGIVIGCVLLVLQTMLLIEVKAQSNSKCTSLNQLNVNSKNLCSSSSLIFAAQKVAPFTADTSDSWSVSWIDFNNDGWDDLFFTNKDSKKPSLLYSNNGKGGFTKITDNNLTKTLSTACTATWADIDNDGDLDVFVANDTRFFNELFINDGKGNLKLNLNSGLSNSVGFYQAASWVDYDRDGFVDLYVGNYCSTRFNELYHNNGNGTFTKITTTPISMQQGNGVGATWADYDNDGFPDLFVPDNHQLKNQLYHNDGNGNFSAVTNNPIVNDGGASVASCWGDIDGDGDLDLFVANSNVLFGNYLYRNDGNGKFTRLEKSNTTAGGHSHGCNFVDIDNDGDLDLYVCNDEGVKFLYLNDGAGNFTAKTDEVLNVDYGYSFANSWSDFDRDGDMDVAIATHSNQKNFLFTNNTNSISKNNWISIKLIGTTSNKSAIGARIKIVTKTKKQICEVNAQSGFGGQNSLWNHFGLGAYSLVDSIIINWPSGIQQVVTKLSVNKFLMISEMPSAKISGKVFQDLNNNCTLDATEKGVANVKIKIQPGNITAISDNNGNYSVSLPKGSYLMTVIPTGNYYAKCNMQSTISIKGTENITAKNFGLIASQNGVDMYTAVSSSALRRGFKNKIVVEYGNKGNQQSGTDTLRLLCDPSVAIISADIPWSFKSENSFCWIVKNLNPSDVFTIQVVDSVSIKTNIGTLITLTTSISQKSTDLNKLNNQSLFSQKTVGAVDPNDMHVYVHENDDNSFVGKNDTLHYRINFQNIGNYEATNVIVTSQIPEGVDAETFTQGVASSNYNVSISGNTITWIFDSILLPYKDANEAGSNGFVEFTMQLNANTSAGSIIMNEAQVQFDYEDPIVTNRVANTVKSEANGNYEMLLFPNPSSNFINLKLNTAENEMNVNIASYNIYNINGQLMIQSGNNISAQPQINISALQSGWYIVETLDEQGNKHQAKFVKE